MSTKNDILSNIRSHSGKTYAMPVIEPDAIRYTDTAARFMEVLKSVGGSAIELQEGEDINARIMSLYPEARSIASNLPEIRIATINPDEIATPHLLNGTALAVVRGEIGVAENGCVWIPQNVKEKAVCFIAEYLLILLDKNNIVSNMHEAYAKIGFNDYGFGVFISGPSKTADIEQALVIGAHGAKGVVVFLTA
ncbi:MAG: LUD domain-containing protein [Tannerellaceae bacterium]|jgi:L-lactate dehydrogenase complex protein LldG|nr:LUD domain-containing protein [Tannerellaceae bacterium]